MPDLRLLTQLVHHFSGHGKGGAVSPDLSEAFRARFKNSPNNGVVTRETIAFTSSPFLHGKFEGDHEERPGYFQSLPYTPAFAQYFMRCALEPNSMERNFKSLIEDINHFANHIYENNPRKSDLQKIIVMKPQMTIGVPYYPTRQYMEAVIAPHLQRMGVTPQIDNPTEFPSPVTP
jgi:hypothetical protein